MRFTDALVLAGAAQTAALNVGPDYRYQIEDLDKDLPFSQPVTFAHLEWQRCLAESHNKPLDVAILGFPYDTSTSYRPGARFGPRGIRAGSSREKKGRSYNTVWGVDPYEEGLEIIDCGDVPITPFDAQHAFKQMEQAYRQILYHPTSDNNQWEHPRIISLGGDHSIVLPILRSLKTVYGPVSVIHLDSHLDTWDPYEGYTGIVSNQSAITHGTFFWHASREGCVRKGTSVHGGLRTKLFGPKDYEIDKDVVGFTIIEAHEIDDIGMNGIIEKVKKAVGDTPVYLSIDIDVLDPSIAPATGTPESGGWTTRELKRFLKGLEGLNMVGADVVEVSPPYDTVAETTSVAAADLIVDILAGMTKKKAFKPAPEVKDEL
ncbi:putative agmatinase 2 [Colletotrichum fructicola]|uniref:Putative agmatinase 2 n=1 Tax=Colletotrichum fructicola (strain Nara gc5) TaxID=1213859 RepID=A0A7J6IK37_COLFN|nr:putative agmatinase 2 [Colletotrichum fructicola]KAF4476998.1 putative agmatinase 2 [Colletotrichum fructicola Nara gc5]KAE9581569.1 putative agmatinase 2 [Colletotrichum fructicola]KAF4427689.1 putative agmatinase 2 [Colletotrichum fructicola]KAF4882434.1 putative agmatinase 2 [Colletotrichum fructicola]KAF4899778.1 putative agmatinase 2 [Colletotrichum fructicola]